MQQESLKVRSPPHHDAFFHRLDLVREVNARSDAIEMA